MLILFFFFFTNEEQRKVGLWCNVHLCLTWQPSAWRHRLCQNGSTHGSVFFTFICWFLTHETTNQLKKIVMSYFFLFHSVWKVPWYFFAWDPIHSWKWPFCCLGATRQIKCSPSTWATVPLKTDLLCSETPWWETIPLSRALFFLQKPSFSSICKQRVSCWVLSPTSHSYSPTSY